MKIIKAKTFIATSVIGLQRGYSNKLIDIETFKDVLLEAQKSVSEHYNVSLSVKLTACDILFLGQEEPSLTLSIIQYPKFLQPEAILKEAFTKLITKLMIDLDQNRIVIQFPDETIMLEQTDAIDHKITLKQN
jgi:hypothetical protein